MYKAEHEARVKELRNVNSAPCRYIESLVNLDIEWSETPWHI